MKKPCTRRPSRWRSLCKPLAGGAAACMLLFVNASAQDMVAQSGETTDTGITLRWSLQQVDGLASLDVETSYAGTGTPVRYEEGSLLGWLQKEHGALVEENQDCATQIRTLATQGVGRRSDIDLAQYRIVTINSDGTVAFINPFVGFNNAKLESIIDLHAAPLDWVEVPRQQQIWLLAGSPAKLNAIDLRSQRAARTIDLPAQVQPAGLAYDARQQRLLFADSAAQRIGMINAAVAESKIEFVATPAIAGLVRASDTSDPLWFDVQGNLYTLGGDGVSSPLGITGKLASFAFSESAKATIVAMQDGDVFSVQKTKPAARLVHLTHDVADIHLLQGGRQMFAVGGGHASLFDLALAKVVFTTRLQTQALQIVASDSFLYAIDQQAGRAELFALEDLRKGISRPVNVMVSGRALGPPGEGPAPAQSRIAAMAPGGSGLLMASPADGMVFQYGEGMMAPMGSYSNYRRAAIGLVIADYAMRETSPGHYHTMFRSSEAGRYKLLIGAAKPQLSSCSRVTLSADQQVAAEVKPALAAELLAVDQQAIRIKIVESGDGKNKNPIVGLRDVTLLVFDRKSGWQRRFRLREERQGEYGARISVPNPSTYDLLAASAGANLSFLEGSLGTRFLGAAQ